jgi:hypothetical protein
MIVIGLGGDIKSGKSTLAGAFAEADPEIVHIESWHPIGEVADKFHENLPEPVQHDNIEWMNKWLRVLPAIVKDVVHMDCDYEQLQFTQNDVRNNPTDFEKLFLHTANLAHDPGLAKQKITEENKPTYRPILQWLGGYLVSRVKPTIWYDEILGRIDDAELLGANLATIGGVRYKTDCESVRRHNRKNVVIKIIRPGMEGADTNDPTERERNLWTPDIRVYNNSKVEDLVNLAPKLLEDIVKQKYKSSYIASERLSYR